MPTWLRFARPAIFILGIAAAALVAAQPEWERPVPLQDMQVTATGAERLTHDVAQAVTLIGRDEARRESPQVSAEILRGHVGTFFQQTTPGQGTAIIRGLKGSQVLHLVDGMRLNNAFFRSAPNQYLALVDPYATAQTEVVRGTAATLYGADAMGGVVQMLTPEIETGGDWTMHGDAYASYAHADRGRILRAEGLAAGDSIGFAGGATWQDYNDRRTGSERVRGSDYDSFAADGKLQIDLSERVDLTLSTQYLEQPNTPRIDELVPGFGQDEPSSEVFSFRPNQREFYHARLRMTPDLGWLDEFEAHLARQDITDDRRTQEFGSVVRIDEANESELTGLTLGFRSRIGHQLQLRYGVEIYQDDISSSRRETDLSSGLAISVPARFPDGAEMGSVQATR
jgi:outer membrane cobalamin receptor